MNGNKTKAPMDRNHAEVVLSSLALTHIRYNPNDPISYLCALLSLLPQALSLVYVTLIWSSREVEVMLIFTGQLLSEALNYLLKLAIREERPQFHGSRTYGMPSSHAQFMAFFAISVTLFLLVRHQPASSSSLPNDSPSTLVQRAVVSLLVCFGAAAVAFSRVYLNYHTPRQVLVGVGAGIAFSIAWFILGTHLRQSGWIQWLLSLELSKMMRVRDLLLGEDFTEAGWQRWKSASRIEKRSD